MSVQKLIVSAMLAAAVISGPVLAADARLLPDFTSIVEQEGRAVVNISTTQTVRETINAVPEEFSGDPFFEFFRRFAPPQQRERKERSLGSGFIVSPDGYVMTNSHVVARAEEITVTLGDKREFKARLIGSDARTDVALLKIEAIRLPVVHLGSSANLKVGEWVLAIGSPFGFESSATSGIVSAKGRSLPDENYVPFIQTDAAVNPGNSGGPLFNLKGEVIGINSQIYSRSGGFMGISFAIPIDVALTVAEQLKTEGKVSRGRIGVAVQELNQDLASSFGLARAAGALVNSVEKGGPADKAGLRAGDIVLKIDGQPVESSADMPRLIGAIRPGKPVRLDIWRDRTARTVTVVLGELKDEAPSIAEREFRQPQKPAEPRSESLVSVGLVLAELTPAQLSRLGIPFGLLVQQVSGPAERVGMAPGDVIVGVGGQALSSARQLREALNAARKGGPIAVQVLRRGVMLFVPLTVGDAK
ncbi:MAG: DegQ family serine endoprotease [Pseudogulbenkiania sp.]|nr:DegQ family serine endoprotease [Pseudogulbenkiania sp.]